MKEIFKYIAVCVIGIFIGLLLFKSFDCSGNTATQIKNEIKALQDSQDKLRDSISASEQRTGKYLDSMLFYAKQKPMIKEYYNYVYNQVDSIVNRDSNDVYRLIRAYTDSILTATE